MNLDRLSQLNLDDRDRRAIRAATRLLRDRFPVERIVLFGSKARGTATTESDIDLLVLSSRPLDWKEHDAITDALFDVQLAQGVVISALVLPTAEWEQGHYTVLPIHEGIEAHGVPV
jgi:predicted nucleotidyltransferase